MKTEAPVRTAVAAIAATSLFFSPASADPISAVTDPVGVVTVEIQPKPLTNRSFNFISLPLIRPAAFSGSLPSGSISTQNGVTVITFQANLFETGAFASNEAPHYFEVRDGNYSGLTSQIIANSASSITLADNISEIIDEGQLIAIRPNWTLATAFPGGNGFQKGTTPTNSDTVVMFDPDTGNTTTYFFHLNFNEWRSGLTPSNNAVIPPDAGIWIERRSTSTGMSIQLTGEVKTTPSALYIGGNAATRRTLAPNLYPLDSVTLAQSGLYTGNVSTGLAGGTTPNNADNLIVYNPVSGNATTYFFNTNAQEWRSGLTPANDVVIPAGMSVMVVRKQNREPFLWQLPAPEMDLQ
jgi:uncharacterized protein (TIGR02597 family)